MLINFKKINFTVVIGILLILVIIYIIYNKKHEVFTGNYPNLSADLEVKLEELVTSCFDEQQQPLLVSEILDKDMLTNPIIKEEIFVKLEDLILPSLYAKANLLRIIAIDNKCGNSNDEDALLNSTAGHLLKIIQSLIIVFREILEITYENLNLPPLNFEDDKLITQIQCLIKKYLPLNDDTINIVYDLNNIEVVKTTPAFIFSIELITFSINFASNMPTDECLNVDILTPSVLPKDYIYLDGLRRICNSQPTNVPTNSPTIPPTNPPTIPPTDPSTIPPATGSPPTGPATLPPNRTSGTTVTGYDSSVASNYSNVTPAPNNLPRGINLINSQGPNNFFLPNIRIS